MNKANIFNIQHFSVHDGPGVRTVVFFKGCNLRCRWCHNPESLHSGKEILLNQERCIGCMACINSCPVGAQSFKNVKHEIDREKCIHCFACAEECYADALTCVGEERQTDVILQEILQNREYFVQSGGGVTFSGGECMLQPEALAELLYGCKMAGIHTAVDTAGNVPWPFFEKVQPWTDLYLYDLKAFDPVVHRACTGVTNERILDNFKKLADSGKDILVRIPWVPELNGEEPEKIALFLADYPGIRAELLPWHSLGLSKYRLLGEENPYSTVAPDKKTVKMLKEKYHFL